MKASMKRILTFILLLLASIQISYVIAWSEDSAGTHSVRPYFRMHSDDDSSYMNPIVRFGIRSVVYQHYNYYVPPSPPQSAPTPKQKLPRDIINDPQSCSDWSVDDFYTAIQSLYTEKIVAKIDDTVQLRTSANSIGHHVDYYQIYADAKNYHYVSHEKLTSLMSAWKLFEYDNFWTAIKKLPYHSYIILNTQAFINGNQSIKDRMTFKARNRLKEEVTKAREHLDKILDHRKKTKQKQDNEQAAFRQRVAKSFEESFEGLYNEQNDRIEYAQWLEEYGVGDAQRIYDRIAAIEDITSSGVQYTEKAFALTPRAIAALQRAGYHTNVYRFAFGNQLQHVIHNDCINLIENIVTIPDRSIAHQHTNALLSHTESAREYNKLGDVRKAMNIADFCYALMDYGKKFLTMSYETLSDVAHDPYEYWLDLAEGTTSGISDVVKSIAKNPENILVGLVAGKTLLAYCMSQVLIDSIRNVTECMQNDPNCSAWDALLKPVTEFITSFENERKKGRHQAVKFLTHTASYQYARYNLHKGLYELYTTTKDTALAFLKKNPTASPDTYLKTPEGVVLHYSSTDKNLLSNNKATTSKNTSSLKEVPERLSHELNQLKDNSLLELITEKMSAFEKIKPLKSWSSTNKSDALKSLG